MAQRLSVGFFGTAALLFSIPDCARPQSLSVVPPGAEISLRAYGLGLFSIDGNFTRFRGALVYPPGKPDDCTVDLTIEAASLSMPDQSMRDDVISPTFLDATAFPTLSYRGVCAAGSIRGSLTMHGQTHPLELSLEHGGGRLVATGRIQRAEWGMTERPIVVGPTVRIRVSVPWGQL